jgi:1,4-dihydroxy-2-naphthoate octaprenyltransferase
MEQWNTLTPKLALWLAAPHTWPASVYPALFGELYCLLAGYTLHFYVGVALLCACVLMQSAVNTFNDYFDFMKGTDTEEDCVEVNDSVLVYSHLNPSHVMILGIAYLGAAILLALPWVITAGIAPLLVGAVGVAAVLFYSGGPVPLSYLPVGECISGIVMGGLIPLGILAVATGGFQWMVLGAALPFILGIGLIMMTNNSCDIEKDIEAERHTLPALLGRKRAVICYRCLIIVWILLLCVMPYLLVGTMGLLSPLLVALVGRKAFGFLLRAPLLQSKRVEQMKGILIANLLGNGAYLMTLAVILVMGGTAHG